MVAFTNDTKPAYGVLKGSGPADSTAKIEYAAELLGCPWVRYAIRIFNSNDTVNYDGVTSNYLTASSLGLKHGVVLVSYPTGITQPFVSAALLPTYKSVVAQILDDMPEIEVVVVANEEMNENYHENALDNMHLYINQLQAVYEVAKPRGVKVANGGFGNHAGPNVLAYRWMVTKYGAVFTENWAQGFMPGFHITAAKNPGTNATLENMASVCQQVLDARDYYDYINFHKYEEKEPTDTDVSPNMWRFYKEWLEAVTGRVIWCNETGQWIDIANDEDIGSNQGILSTKMMNEFARHRIMGVFIWDGRGPFAIPYSTESLIALRPNGQAYRNFLHPLA